jgi:hypothetical protein
MTVQPAPPAPRPTLASQVPLLLATLIVGIAGGWSLGALVYPGKVRSRPLVQRGHVQYDARHGLELHVQYAIPFAEEPSLTFDAPGTEIQEQRADGFKVRLEGPADASRLGWTAEGMSGPH